VCVWVCACVRVCVRESERESVGMSLLVSFFWGGGQTGHFQETYVTKEKFVEVRHFSDLPPGVKEGDKVVLGDLGQVSCGAATAVSCSTN
jgi:hypothetical protein